MASLPGTPWEVCVETQAVLVAQSRLGLANYSLCHLLQLLPLPRAARRPGPVRHSRPAPHRRSRGGNPRPLWPGQAGHQLLRIAQPAGAGELRHQPVGDTVLHLRGQPAARRNGLQLPHQPAGHRHARRKIVQHRFAHRHRPALLNHHWHQPRCARRLEITHGHRLRGPGGQLARLGSAHLLVGHHPPLLGQPPIRAAHWRHGHTRGHLRHNLGPVAGHRPAHVPAHPDLHHRLPGRIHAHHAQHHPGSAGRGLHPDRQG